MNKKYSKIFAAVLSATLTVSAAVAGGSSVNAAETEDEKIGEVPSRYYNSTICDTADYLQAVRLTADTQEEIQLTENAVKNYVSSVDNSKDPYFPLIGDQGGVGSCTAWSTVYYTFTHEMNRALGRPTTPENTFQPLFIYNLVVGGHPDWGTASFTLNELLSFTGCATLKSVPDSYEATSWNAAYDIWREANDYRVGSFMSFKEPGKSDSRVTSVDDPDIEPIKAALRAGHVLSYYGCIFSYKYEHLTACADDPSINEGHVNDFVVSRTIGEDGLHGMTIVGYNDEIWTDINYNGKVDDGEMGAFRIANSWGKGDRDGGFFWIAYDALNRSSMVDGVGYEEDRNISIEAILQQNINRVKKSSNIYLKYTLNSKNRHDSYLDVTATRKSDGMRYTMRTAPNNTIGEQGERYDLNYMGGTGYGDGTMIMDLDNVIHDLDSDNFNDYDWSVKFYDAGNDDGALTVKDACVIDENAARTYPLDAELPFAVNGEEKTFSLKKCYQFRSMSITPNKKAVVNQPVRITVKADNETRENDPIKYNVVITRGDKVVCKKTFKASSFDREKRTATASVKWTPTIKGSYHATVSAVDASGSSAVRSMDFEVYSEKLMIRSIDFNTDTHVGNYEKVRITPHVTGGSEPYTYSYYYTKGGKKYTIAENSKSAYKTKTFGRNTGTYKMTVVVKDSAGKTASLSKNVIVDGTVISNIDIGNERVQVGDYTWISTKVSRLANAVKDAKYVYTVTKDGKTETLPDNGDNDTWWYPKEYGVHTINVTLKYNDLTIASRSVDFNVVEHQSNTRTISVNVISYICKEANEEQFTVHYWGGADGSGDVTCKPLNKTTTYSVGKSYWNGAEKTFYQYTVEIPKDATGFKFHIGNRWFGSDGNTSSSNSVYIFNYSGDKALYTKI